MVSSSALIEVIADKLDQYKPSNIVVDPVMVAKGCSLAMSVDNAKAYLSGALAAMLDLGRGSGPLAHNFTLMKR